MTKWMSMKLKQHLTTLILLSIAVLALSNQAWAQQPKVTIEVYPNGAAYITISLTDVASEEVTLSLIGKPEPDYILAYDEDELPLPYNITDDSIVIYTVGSSKITLEYVTYSLCSMSMGIWRVNITSPYDFTLMLPIEAEVIGIEGNLLDISVKNNTLSMTFSKGTTHVEYILPATMPLPQQPLQEQPQPPPQTKEQQPTGQEAPAPPIALPWHMITVIIIAIAVVAAISAIALRRRASSSLSGVETAILNYLKSRGGSAFQEEISRDLSIPKSTLSRAIASLRGKGLISVKKVSRRNYISLT